jgi:hypothetical protein
VARGVEMAGEDCADLSGAAGDEDLHGGSPGVCGGG